MSDAVEPEGPLAEVGRYSRLAEARERALVIAARDLPHWIEREGDEWILRVEESAREVAARELAAFEQEERARPAPAPLTLPEKLPTFSLYVAAWLMSGFFLVQQIAGPEWTERGASSSAAILTRGEWWRAVTALTLHADLPHVAINLGMGLLFVAFVIPHLGVGAAWLGVLLAGTLGNLLNAWGYRGESHSSIGASTAVFGALGLLVGAEFLQRWAAPHTRSRWQLVLPVGAGLAFLAFLGAGEETRRVDFMAHLWGFTAGLPLGFLAVSVRLKERSSRFAQRACALATVVILGFAWWLAWH
ncbi:MAG TPA: rhomboid family intramembrane serine protease [Chthoniobacteraceae bacterium]|jgi:membrane associated rhomboid family serine protease